MKPLTLADKLDAAEAGRVLPYSFEGKPSEALLKWGHDMGYAVNARTGFFEPESQQDEPAILRCVWLSWADEALTKQGFTATTDEYFETHIDRPDGSDLGTFGWVNSRPFLLAVNGRQPTDDAKFAERYQVTAASFVKDGRVPGERVPELHARVEALHRRIEWELTRMGHAPEIDGWLRVLWREVQKAVKLHGERGEYGRASTLHRLWDRLRDIGIGQSAPIPKALNWAEYLLRDELELNAELCRAQLSGLAYILHQREPVVRRLVEWNDALEVYDPILEAALLDASPLSEEALRRAEASRRKPGNPAVLAGAIPDDIVDEMERTARGLHAANPEHYGIRRQGGFLSGNLTAELADRFAPYTATGIAGRLRPRFKARPLGDSSGQLPS